MVITVSVWSLYTCSFPDADSFSEKFIGLAIILLNPSYIQLSVHKSDRIQLILTILIQ